jgi:hypothetical protein
MTVRHGLPVARPTRPSSHRSRLLPLLATAALAITIAGPVSAGPSKVTYVFTNITLNGANSLIFGYTTGGSDTYVFNSGVGSVRRLTVTLPVGSDLTVFLRDETCDKMYYANGTGDGNHATLVPTKRGFTIDIADAGAACVNASTTQLPAAGFGNLTLTEVIR